MDNQVVIELDDKMLGFKFTIKTLELITERKGIEFGDLADYFSKRPFGMVNSILLYANIVYNRGTVESDPYEVDDWIETMSQEQLQEIWDCFELSMRRNIEKITRKDIKKN